MKLPPTEEILMQHLWNRERAFLKDLLEAYEEPRPAPTTLATLLKRMIDRGVVGYRERGNAREYFPLITRQAYFSAHVNGLIKGFFNDSAAQFASFFTTETNLSVEELEALKKIIDDQLQQKKS
jgi:BlaI family penicillinase repressor